MQMCVVHKNSLLSVHCSTNWDLIAKIIQFCFKIMSPAGLVVAALTA